MERGNKRKREEEVKHHSMDTEKEVEHEDEHHEEERAQGFDALEGLAFVYFSYYLFC